MMKFKLIVLCVCFLVISCTSVSENGVSEEGNQISAIPVETNSQVGVVDVSSGPFDMEIISNGKVIARQSADLSFTISGKIKTIHIRNGQTVGKGQVLAILNEADFKRNVQRRREGVEKAKVDLDDRLIDYGYRLKDSAKVPLELMRMAKIKSAYNTAIYDYIDAIHSLNRTVLVAPFSGKIANLETHEFNATDGSLSFCKLINDRQMDVEFNVLETEYHFFFQGSFLDVIPFDGSTPLSGRVDQVNPLIDDNGMIKVIGTVSNPNGILIDGMRVKVIVKKTIPDQIFVPKNAVLDRQGRKVVFTYENGFAKWNYVETNYENSKYISIRDGLKKGQQVIVTNNFNLAHDSKVSLDKGG